MERRKLANEASDSNFLMRKWNIVNDQSNASYAEVLKSNLCNYKDAYISVKGNINSVGNQETQIAFKIVQHLLNVSQKLMEQQ